MTRDALVALLSGALALNAVLGFGYRVFRLTRGGPMGDVIGQGMLGALLVGLALGIASGATALRWAALAYAVVFGVLVMPLWTIAVLIPMRPGRVDAGFTTLYWVTLAVIAVAALAL
jgi:hypothetical protein